MRNKFEKDYNERLNDAKKKEEEKYLKNEKIKEDKIIKSKNEFKNTNEMLIAQKNEAKKMDYNRDVEYDNRINDKIKKQMDYMEEKDYRRKEEKKLRYKQALDKQMDQQRIRKKMEYDIENGNFSYVHSVLQSISCLDFAQQFLSLNNYNFFGSNLYVTKELYALMNNLYNGNDAFSQDIINYYKNSYLSLK